MPRRRSSKRTALPSLAIHLGRTKTASGEQDEVVYLTGRPVEALHAWIAAARIDKGSVFRGIGRWGTLSRRALDPQSISAIFKQRVEMTGLDPAEFSAHGLRSGYLTEAANRRIPLVEAMEQSRHRSLQQASSYYNGAPAEPRGCYRTKYSAITNRGVHPARRFPEPLDR